MSTTPPLSLRREEATRLLTYMQEYRHVALAHLPPSPERNRNMRTIQTMQGMLIHFLDQQPIVFSLILNTEEILAIRAMAKDLLTIYGTLPETSERNSVLADLAGLKLHLRNYYQEGR